MKTIAKVFLTIPNSIRAVLFFVLVVSLVLIVGHANAGLIGWVMSHSNNWIMSLGLLILAATFFLFPTVLILISSFSIRVIPFKNFGANGATYSTIILNGIEIIYVWKNSDLSNIKIIISAIILTALILLVTVFFSIGFYVGLSNSKERAKAKGKVDTIVDYKLPLKLEGNV